MMRNLIVVGAWLGSSALAVAGPIWTLKLLPSADLFAAPGKTVGWGYTITNPDPQFWLVPFNLTADLFEHGIPTSLFLFPGVGPGGIVTVPYDGVDGLYEFAWDSDAPLNFSNVGLFVVSADWFDADPSTTGVFRETAATVEVPYSVRTEAPAIVPEPGTLLITAMCAIAIGIFRRFPPRRG
jgi:hypothetical protein